MSAPRFDPAIDRALDWCEVAKILGITPSYMNDIWLGRRRLTARILKNTPGGQCLFFRQAGEEAKREWAQA